MDKILITGITGQDGKYLTKKILVDFPDAQVLGTTRNRESHQKFLEDLKLVNLTNFKNISLKILDLENIDSVEKLIAEFEPHYLINLTGPSSVYDSFKNPKKSYDQITQIFLNLTKTLINQKNFCNFFQASSSEMFAKSNSKIINELSKIGTNSPYGQAKYYCHKKTLELSNEYNWNIVSGIMFNHESIFRSNEYLIMKIIDYAIKISRNEFSKFEIGSLNYIRDWMHAEDTTEAIYNIISNPKSNCYVIGSGNGTSIEYLVKNIFSIFNLDYEKYTSVNPKLIRNGDANTLIADPAKLKNDYGWKQQHSIDSLIEELVNFKLSN